MPSSSYLVALGSNRPGRHGRPEAELAAALAALHRLPGTQDVRASPLLRSAPLGPSQRRFANAAALVESDLAPPALLAALKRLERAAGRRRGRRWGARVLDLDVALWSGGRWRSRGLSIPHPALRQRRFVLDPAAALVPGWRDPVTGLTVRQLAARLTARRPLPRSPGRRVCSSVGRACDF